MFSHASGASVLFQARVRMAEMTTVRLPRGGLYFYFHSMTHSFSAANTCCVWVQHFVPVSPPIPAGLEGENPGDRRGNKEAIITNRVIQLFSSHLSAQMREWKKRRWNKERR